MPVQISLTDAIGLGGLLVAVLPFAGALLGHGLARRKTANEVASLRDQAADAITSAAANAVDVVEKALNIARAQLAQSNAELDKLQASLTSLEALLQQARQDLDAAIADRDTHAQARVLAERQVSELQGTIDDLRARVDQLEQTRA